MNIFSGIYWKSILLIQTCAFIFFQNLDAQNTQELFDDFSYSDCNDPNLASINNWSIVNGPNGPPEGGIYSKENIEFIDDIILPSNRIMSVSTFIDKLNSIITHARIETADMSYRHGTFAARVYFDDTPATYLDGNVETFYSISNYFTCKQANLYSECDFEYLPWDSWNSDCETSMYYTTWETCILNTSDHSKKSFAGWHNLVYTSSETGIVKYYVDGIIQVTHSQYTPDADANISFANWIFENKTGEGDETRKTSMLIDWVYHAKNNVFTTDEVISKVDALKSDGIIRKNLEGVYTHITQIGKVFTESNNLLFTLFPNPSSSGFSIKFHGTPNLLQQINIYSSNGSIIQIVKVNEIVDEGYIFSMANCKLVAGIYWCSLQMKDTISMQRIVISD